MPTDFYEVLGIAPEASQDEIRKAFRSLARKYHPDATGGDAQAAERYKRISEAYAVLSDPGKRREYDASRLGGVFSPFASTIEDIFESFFGSGTRRPRQRTRSRSGESIEVEMELDLRDAIFGTKRTARFRRYEPCERCTGVGAEPGSQVVTCTRCNGTGQVQEVRRSVFGNLVTSYPCVACQETGQVVAQPCGECAGQGRVPEDAEITFEVPPGIENGDRVRLSGEGEAGVSGGGPGDLYVRFHVREDDRFVRSGNDLVTWAEVPMTTASLGGDMRFESFDGGERITIPKGTQSGDLFRVRGHGAPRRQGRGRGDLLVRVHVLTPANLDGEQERLLRQLADQRGETGDGGDGIIGRLRRALGIEDG